MNRLRVVLDTNVFLVSLAKHYKYHWIFEAILKNKLELCVSTEILLEYQEQIAKRYGLSLTDSTLDFLLLLDNVLLITPHFNWELIKTDVDDNKFVDCAITGNADYVVTNDNDFKIIDEVQFPPIKRIKADVFSEKFKLQILNSGL